MEPNLTPFLTPKQKMFCDEYLTDRNATAAALRAGYSRETALSGYLMTLPKIKLYLEQQMGAIAEQVQVSHAQVLQELCKIAFGNMANYFAADGSMKPMDALTEDDKAALWNVSIGDGENGAVTKIRMYNKLAALEKIAKHINFYKPQATEQKIVYKYVTTADITEDDTFDDPILQKEITEREASGKEKDDLKKWEVLRETQESRGKNQEVENEEEEDLKVALSDLEQLTAIEAEIVIKAIEPEAASSKVEILRPNFDMTGLSGRKLSEQERAERKKYRSYWMR